MAYRKFIADQLFTGETMLGDDAVLVVDETGVVAGITVKDDAGPGIERFNGILAPGFINCHCHLELSHMKGVIPQQSGMIEFLLTVMNSRNVDPGEIMASASLAEQYMWERGIVATGDICNTADTLPLKSTSAMYYHNFIEVTGFTPAAADARFAKAFELYSKFAGSNFRHKNSIVPHAPYSVSDELFALVNDFQKESLLSIHNQESEAESEFFITGKGAMTELYRALAVDTQHFTGNPGNSLVHCLEKISPEHALILVHNVHTSHADLNWIKNRTGLPDLFWCLCPNANLYINGRLPDVYLLKEQGCNIIVGTDSFASNNQLNILEELKTLEDNFPSLTAAELLKWATLNGAKALRIQDMYGSFEKGKTPGVVHIDGGINGTLAGSVAKKIL